MFTGRAKPEETPSDGIGKELWERAHDVTSDTNSLEAYLALLESATAEDVNYVSTDTYYDGEGTLHRLVDEVGKAMDEAEQMPLLLAIIEKVVALGADVKLKKTDGRTPLHRLLYSSSYRTWNDQSIAFVATLVDVLLNAGALLDARNQHHATPLDEVGHPAIARRLLARGAMWAGWPSGCLHALEYDERWADVAEMAKLGAKLAAPEAPGINLLTYIAAAAPVARYEELVALGAQWPELVKEVDSPLIRAAASGHAALVRHLAPLYVEHIDHRGNYGRTALLSLANWMRDSSDKDARTACADAACELVRLGADLNAKDNYDEVAIAAMPTKVIRDKLLKIAVQRQPN